MNWIKKQSSFKYCSKPVTRTTMICQTPIGEFKVYESVGGNAFIIHPFIVDTNGFLGYDNGTEEWFGKPKIRVKSLEEGIKRCEQKWNQIKKAINEI